ncbi:methionine ABC transporter ATP-binding protein [Alkalicoccobacillus murimartini]|uniref:D-methionine transport system ATP-binding protein n=1 Tax=Alkalicoccobacillus murimartini TaxID=171685 RepID=A0ABT9YBP8_9BACI|nr:ATP-binding cassette domain-containing protein [Alkalicoccobacillus murimartini]MDQ0205267.1 D-methionine transport system ATP-binding protein [Alkalicoccobacillus murimartini]
MIEIKSVSKTFNSKKGKVEALKDVSLTVKKGEIFGVVGYSGAGKSTLIRAVNQLEQVDKGNVIIDGSDLTKMSRTELRSARKGIGMIFQGFNLLRTATVYQNIAIPLKLAGVPSEEIDERVKRYLQIVGLEGKHDSFPAQLSGGQKQRVAIARALSHEPDVLLSDEATSALDPETTESILNLLLKINREFGITILLITHEMHVIQKICDQVAVMENGEIIEQGKVVELFSNAKQQTTKKFINSLFPDDIPGELIQSLSQTGPIVSLSFVGHSTGKPALSLASKQFDVHSNILSGNIVQLKDEPYGRLVTHLQGSDEETSKTIEFLRAEGVRVEEVSNREL